MAKRASFNPKRVTDIPAGPWVAHSAELIASPAWRARSIHVARLLDRIELEHCAHAGRENGYLTVTYRDFVEYGIGRKFIKRAIDRAVQLGLLVVHPGLYRGGAKRQPSLYQLTYLKSKFVPVAGAPYYLESIHDWRKFAPVRTKKSSRMVPHGELPKVTHGELPDVPGRPLAAAKIADFAAQGRK
jgi:hypothetical protein